MQTLTRGYDIACRYGGEEFTLVLPDAALDVTTQRAEQLREKFKHMDVNHEGRSFRPCTLSLGVAEFPEHGQIQDIILPAADGALYRAKKEGRDRVAVAKSIP